MAEPDSESPPREPSLLRREMAEIFAANESDRPWQLPASIALAAGLPMVAGAWTGYTAEGSIASIGAMTIIYLPRTTLDRRLAALMAVSCAMIACFALGLASHLVPALAVPLITLVAFLVSVGCRYYRVGPPGPLFFVMAAAIGAYVPSDLAMLPYKLGVFALGSLFAVAIGFAYSVYILRHREALPPPERPDDIAGEVLAASIVIALIVGLSLAAAEVLGFEKPYWVPVSCLAVMQGSHMRAVWNRQVQRIFGTGVGLVATWGLLLVANTPLHMALAVVVLLFIVETIVVRQYALAAIFITPLAITLAESSIAGPHIEIAEATPLLVARLQDTVLGSVLGLLGGLCLHTPAIRDRLKQLCAAMMKHSPVKH